MALSKEDLPVSIFFSIAVYRAGQHWTVPPARKPLRSSNEMVAQGVYEEQRRHTVEQLVDFAMGEV